MNIHGSSVSFQFIVQKGREFATSWKQKKRLKKTISIEIFTAEWLKVIMLVKTFLSWFLYVFLKEVSESAIFPDDWFSFSIWFSLFVTALYELFISYLIFLIPSLKPLIFNLISKSQLLWAVQILVKIYFPMIRSK